MEKLTLFDLINKFANLNGEPKSLSQQNKNATDNVENDREQMQSNSQKSAYKSINGNLFEKSNSNDSYQAGELKNGSRNGKNANKSSYKSINGSFEGINGLSNSTANQSSNNKSNKIEKGSQLLNKSESGKQVTEVVENAQSQMPSYYLYNEKMAKFVAKHEQLSKSINSENNEK